MVANLLNTERRAASVGCAVNTGRTEKLASQFFISLSVKSLFSNFAFSIWSTAREIQELPSSRALARILERCTCSATLAKLK